MSDAIAKLISNEGWQVYGEPFNRYVVVEGIKIRISNKKTDELEHPVTVHLKVYREHSSPEIKFKHMKSAHDYLWPHHRLTWNDWTERRFREHCDVWKCVTWAGGASCGKSYDAAKIGILFWLANPRKRSVLVMSTTLESLNSRIYGYITGLLLDMQVRLPWRVFEGNNPRVMLPVGRGMPKDFRHCITALAASRGDDEKAIATLKGRHPEEGMMVICDECTDLPIAILGVIPNLTAKIKTFQLLGIGNSTSKFDLHGSLSTPLAGWKSIDPFSDYKWETTQKLGVCLFFSCYESPAITETDPEKRFILSRFLITLDQISEKLDEYGEHSLEFFRMVLGYWKSDASDDLVISQQFLTEYPVSRRTEWGGDYPLRRVGGLDPAFSTGGDSCIFRIGLLGTDVNGLEVLDFRDKSLLFNIKIDPQSSLPAEKQIAVKLLAICKEHGVAIGDICIDANGQGRALGSVISLMANTMETPIKIYSCAAGNLQVNSFDVVLKTPHEMWFSLRDFIQQGQIQGLDLVTIQQLTSRLEFVKGGKKYLEPKKEYKKRMGAQSLSLAHSPDEADGTVLCLQAAIIRYGFSPGRRRVVEVEAGFEHEKMREFRLMQEQGATGPVRVNLETPCISADFTGTLEDMVSAKFGD